MRRAWLTIPIIFLSMFLSFNACTQEVEAYPFNADDERYYEMAYESCLVRYQRSRLGRLEMECVCDKLSNYAVDWRRRHSNEPLPAAPQSLYADCLR